jgi:sarcosine oxidase subunit alpha
LAARALGGGVTALTRSFRFHRPRGAFCHRGWCQQCRVTLPDGRLALACQEPAGGSLAVVRPRRWLRPLGWLAERLPPWFHEDRFLRPRALRQAYLGVLRRASGALPLPLPPVTLPARWRPEQCRTLVVGGGLAGLSAAAALGGAGPVILVEGERLGGSAALAPRMRGEAASALQAARAAGATLIERAFCIGLYDGARRALCTTPDGPVMVRFDELVIATGAYDRLPACRGSDLPGILGPRGFELLAAQGAIPSGAAVGAFAHDEEADRIAAAAAAAGRSLAWLAGPGAPAGDRRRTQPGRRLRRILGWDRVTGIELDDGTRLACDLLVLGFSQPRYELPLQAGRSAGLDGDLPVIVTAGDGIVPLLVVGEAAGTGLAEAGRHAREAVAAWRAGRPPRAVQRERPAAVSEADPDAILCLCEDVRVRDVRAAVADGFANIELVKRRTGAATGPCQGKLCHAELAGCLRDLGAPVALPTMRPLLRPVALGELAGLPDG